MSILVVTGCLPLPIQVQSPEQVESFKDKVTFLECTLYFQHYEKAMSFLA